MGHISGYLVYPENCNKSLVVQEICDYADREGDGYPSRPKWHTEVPPLRNHEEAENWIKAHDNGWYDDHAVRYYDYSKAKPTKKIGELETRLRELCAKEREYTGAHSVRTFKAQYISCPKCGSKLARTRLWSELCPLCRTDLRSKTTLDTIANYQKREEELRKQIQAEKEKQKGEVMWLIKYEFHC